MVSRKGFLAFRNRKVHHTVTAWVIHHEQDRSSYFPGQTLLGLREPGCADAWHNDTSQDLMPSIYIYGLWMTNKVFQAVGCRVSERGFYELLMATEEKNTRSFVVAHEKVGDCPPGTMVDVWLSEDNWIAHDPRKNHRTIKARVIFHCRDRTLLGSPNRACHDMWPRTETGHLRALPSTCSFGTWVPSTLHVGYTENRVFESLMSEA